MKNNFEIGIIGGGPAGSASASFLAKFGFDVCLFEKRIFPRETLCGEFLSSEVIHFLKQLGLYDQFISLKPNTIRSFRFFNSSGKSIYSEFNFRAFGLSRSSLDNLLLCNAKRKGVTVFQPAEVKEISFLKNCYRLIINSDGIENEIFVNELIGAYGKQNSLDNYLNRSFIKYRSKLNGIKFHLNKNELKEFNQDEIQIYSAENIYCGVNAVEDDNITFCFLEDRRKELPPPRKQLVELQKKNRSFQKLFNPNSENLFEDSPVYGTGNIFFGKRDIVNNGIFLIGDTAGVIAPLAGDGIGIAMESGKLIADILYKKRKNSLSKEQAENLYKKEWELFFQSRMSIAEIIQKIILTKYGKEIGFSLVKLFPFLLPYLIKSTRNIFHQKI